MPRCGWAARENPSARMQFALALATGAVYVPPMKKIYVGNLPFSSTEADLRQMFSQHGAVESAALVTDRETGQPRGFGFVEMSNDNEANAAITALNGQSVGGRALVVNEARPREGGGGGGRGGGGGDRW